MILIIFWETAKKKYEMNVRKLYLPFDFGTLDTVIELTLTKNIYKKFKELFSLYFRELLFLFSKLYP